MRGGTTTVSDDGSMNKEVASNLKYVLKLHPEFQPYQEILKGVLTQIWLEDQNSDGTSTTPTCGKTDGRNERHAKD